MTGLRNPFRDRYGRSQNFFARFQPMKANDPIFDDEDEEDEEYWEYDDPTTIYMGKNIINGM